MQNKHELTFHSRMKHDSINDAVPMNYTSYIEKILFIRRITFKKYDYYEAL